MAKEPTYYDVLRLSKAMLKDAFVDRSSLQEAYKRINDMKEDKDLKREKTQEVDEAYKVLSDKTFRNIYDKLQERKEEFGASEKDIRYLTSKLMTEIDHERGSEFHLTNYDGELPKEERYPKSAFIAVLLYVYDYLSGDPDNRFHAAKDAANTFAKIDTKENGGQQLDTKLNWDQTLRFLRDRTNIISPLSLDLDDSPEPDSKPYAKKFPDDEELKLDDDLNGNGPYELYYSPDPDLDDADKNIVNKTTVANGVAEDETQLSPKPPQNKIEEILDVKYRIWKKDKKGDFQPVMPKDGEEEIEGKTITRKPREFVAEKFKDESYKESPKEDGSSLTSKDNIKIGIPAVPNLIRYLQPDEFRLHGKKGKGTEDNSLEIRYYGNENSIVEKLGIALELRGRYDEKKGYAEFKFSNPKDALDYFQAISEQYKEMNLAKAVSKAPTRKP